MLIYLSLFAVLPPALAVPIDLQDAIASRVPESLRPFAQEIINFFNPHYSPSLNQTIISCLTLLFISAFSIGPSVAKYPNRVLSMIRLRLGSFLYGLISPDFYVMTASRRAFTEAGIAVLYNRIFHKEDPKKGWSRAHGAFVSNGGFVLWENDQPTKVLRLEDLVRMTKAGEIERPDMSKKEVLARSIPARGRISVWFLPFPILWFVWKFARKLPVLVLFVALHALLVWWGVASRCYSMVGVKEPVVIIRKPREKADDKLVLEDDEKKSEEAISQELVDLDDGTMMVETKSSAFDLMERGLEPDTNTDVASHGSEQTSPTQAITVGSLVFSCLSLPVIMIADLLVALAILIPMVISATTVSMRAQWNVISGPHVAIFTSGNYLAGTIVTLVGWTYFFMGAKHVPFPSDVEQQIWRAASLFLLLQPLILLLAPPRLRMRINESVRLAVFVLYNIVYSAARLSIFFIAFYSIRKAV